MKIIYEWPVTLLLHYWYPEASILRYPPFNPLVVHPTLNKIAIILGSKVLPDQKKVSTPFALITTLSFQPFNRIDGNSMLFYDIVDKICVPVILVWTRRHFLSPIILWVYIKIFPVHWLGKLLISWIWISHAKVWSNPPPLGFIAPWKKMIKITSPVNECRKPREKLGNMGCSRDRRNSPISYCSLILYKN